MTALWLWPVAGFGLGLVYFAALRRTADLFAASGRGFLQALLTLARLIGIAAFLSLAASYGALQLLLVFLGFLGARALALCGAFRTA